MNDNPVKNNAQKNILVAEAMSVLNALRGLGKALVRDWHVRIHLLVVPITIVLVKFVLDVTLTIYAWGALGVVWCLMFSVELLNTALEETLDLLHPGRHEKVAFAKDVAAAAVFMSAVAYVMTLGVVLWPHLFSAAS